MHLYVLLFAFLASIAQADTYCDSVAKYFPEACSSGALATKPAGANSTFSEGFNISAASLPTEPSSYGLETLITQIRQTDGSVGPTFSLIKGFHRFGTGISTGSNNTFYGDDVVERLNGPSDVTALKPSETPKGSANIFCHSNLNARTAATNSRSQARIFSPCKIIRSII